LAPGVLPLLILRFRFNGITVMCPGCSKRSRSTFKYMFYLMIPSAAFRPERAAAAKISFAL
jgi:hypothetical protein